MTIAFGWKYELVAFDPTQIKDAIVNKGTASSDFCTVPNNGVSITELNIKADIKSSKATKASSSKSTISLYNCSDDTLFYLKERNTVILWGGFKEQTQLPLLFVGTISKVSSRKEGADTLTTLVCEDSKFAKNNATLGLSLPPETYTYYQVIEALLAQAGKWGVPSEFITKEGIVTEKIKGGVTLEGDLFRELEKFCSSIQYKVVYHLGRIRVEPKQYENSVRATIINNDNILQGIHFTGGDTSKSSSDTEQNSGITFTTFLNGAITINGDVVNGVDLHTPIYVDISGFEGLYDPISITHKMEFEGRMWHTVVEAKRRV